MGLPRLHIWIWIHEWIVGQRFTLDGYLYLLKACTEFWYVACIVYRDIGFPVLILLEGRVDEDEIRKNVGFIHSIYLHHDVRNGLKQVR